MNTNLFKLAAFVIFFAAEIENASAQVYTGIIGYVPCIFMTGSNLFNNPLQTASNNLSYLIQPIIKTSGTIPIPQGTTVSLWNPTNSSFDTTSTYSNGSWSVDLILPPGTGVLVFAPKQFTNTIMGELLDHDGN